MMNLSNSLTVKAKAEIELRRRRKERKGLGKHKSSLLCFTKYTFPDFEDQWFHRAASQYLDRWIDGDIKRLMLFMPPRHGKSELVSRRLPAYIFGKYPSRNIISASYGSDLASMMNLDVQRIIDSEKYAKLFPETRLKNSNVRNNKKGGSWLRNSDIFEVVDQGGVYRSAGVGGAITGMGMHYGIIDDPVKNRQDASSPTVSRAVYDWYTSTFRTRMIKDASILLTVTRWDENDLAGRLLQLARDDEKADQWTVIKFPAICDGTGGDDDIREEGEALWPSWYGKEWLDATRASLGEYDWSSLYQQSPTTQGGSIYQSDWWDIETRKNRYNIHDHRENEKIIGRWLFADTAFKSGMNNDYSAVSVFELMPDYRIRLRHVWRDKIDSSFLPDIIEQLSNEWNYDSKLMGVVVEDKGSGTTSIQTLRRSAPEWLAEMIVEFTPTGAKEYRAKQAAIWCYRSCVLLPYVDESLDWYNSTIGVSDGELFKFPNAAHDDFTDTFTMAIIYLENYLTQGYHARSASNA